MSPSSPSAKAQSARTLPRGAHADWHPAPDRPDPVQTLIDQGRERIPALLPLRYARMRTDPFAFFRGAAAIMAADLATQPDTGLRLQACGDCHLANFGAYATPEGTPVFDLNDFDETLPAPFEWDVKRLAASLAVAGRVAGLGDGASRKLARRAARNYRGHMGELAGLSPLAAWNSRIDLAAAIADIDEKKLRRRLQDRLAAAMDGAQTHFGLVTRNGAAWRIRDKPPLVHHVDAHALDASRAFDSYAKTLQEDRRVLLARYRLADIAFKVVGVGSVGTFCAIGLFAAADESPLLLQIKQAQTSVLAPFAGASAYANQGQRVVVGQRMMQAATDLFLGWTAAEPATGDRGGRFFYVRRLKDSRLAEIGAMIEEALPFYATLCGRTLARAHARAGDAAAILAYLGTGDVFDEAIADFAMAYADQTARDWHAFNDAIAAGRISATT
jgi:uncharacterized protein (DUF2252 family)